MKLKKFKGLLKNKKLKKIIRTIILTSSATSFIFFCIYFIFVLVPLYLFTSTVASYDINDLLDITDNTYKPPIAISSTGQVYELSGGLTAMGINFDTIIKDLQTQYLSSSQEDDKNKYSGMIAYAQLYQLLDTTTEVTNHPIMLLGVAMGIRETSTFSSNYSNFAKNKMNGPNPENGIYGTWCNIYINGVPSQGGGVIPHILTKASAIAKEAEQTEFISGVEFEDVAAGFKRVFALNQKYNTVVNSGGNALGYNKGAYGPLQIEADHWTSWVCPFISNNNAYLPYLEKAYLNIPITDKRFDNLYSAQISNIQGYSKSVVTSANRYLNAYKQNQEFMNNIMTTLGQSNYLSAFANMVNNTAEGQSTFGKGYYFAGRFTKQGQEWDDWVMSLEAWPHAYTLLASERIGKYCMYENTAKIKDETGKEVASSAYQSQITEVFGNDFTFVNKIASDIYWTLEMLQSWNYGNTCETYSSYENYQYLTDIAYLYRELANYIAVYGTEAIRAETENWQDSCYVSGSVCQCDYLNYAHTPSHYSGTYGNSRDCCNKAAFQTYKNLVNLITTANGTYGNEDYKKIMQALETHQNMQGHKNNYAYAITAILDAEAYAQANIKEIFGIENFSIFNYGSADIQTAK